MDALNELNQICSIPEAGLASADLGTLYGQCLSPVQAFALPWVELTLVIVAAVAGIAIGIGVRIKNGAEAGAVVGGAIETSLYAAAGAYFGSVGGLILAEFAPPLLLGIVAFALSAAVLVGGILGLVHGDGGVIKILGCLVLLLFAAAFAFAGVGCVLMKTEAGAATDYHLYLNVVALALGGIGAFNGLIVGASRAASPFTGWLIIPIVSAWGFLGTTLGLLMHLASWFFFADFGKRNETCAGARGPACNTTRNLLGFVAYGSGFRVMPDYYFSQGSVMTADTKHGVWHEAVHVLQHVIFGPIFVASYFLWLVLGAIVGLIVGAFKEVGPWFGAMAGGYVNNPWEVWEYMSSWNGVSSSARILPTHNAATETSMVWGNGAALGVGIAYFVVCTGALALWIVLRIGV